MKKTKWKTSEVGEKEHKSYDTKRMKLKRKKTQWYSLLGWTIFCALVIYVPTVINDDIVRLNLKAQAQKQQSIRVEQFRSLGEQLDTNNDGLGFNSVMKNEVMELIHESGLDMYEAYMIIQCESHWNPDAINTKNTNGSYDSGLWQINSIHKDISNLHKFDYIKSTKWAITKRLHDGNWNSWVCSGRLGI